MEHPSSPFHFHRGLNNLYFFAEVLNRSSYNQALHEFLNLFGRDMLLKLNFSGDSFEDKLLLTVPLHMASKNPLNIVDRVFLRAHLCYVKRFINHSHYLVSTDPHFPAPVDRCQIEYTFHHELSRLDSLG